MSLLVCVLYGLALPCCCSFLGLALCKVSGGSAAFFMNPFRYLPLNPTFRSELLQHRNWLEHARASQASMKASENTRTSTKQGDVRFLLTNASRFGILLTLSAPSSVTWARPPVVTARCVCTPAFTRGGPKDLQDLFSVTLAIPRHNWC